MAYTEKRIRIKSFKLRQNPNIMGSHCAFNDKHFIDYRQECYIHPGLKIIICIKCRDESYKNSDQLKYHNKKSVYNGIKYDSNLEVNRAKTYDLLKRIGEIKDWERQKKLEFNLILPDDNAHKYREPILTTRTQLELKTAGIKFYHLTNYYVDFIIYHNDGSTEFIECKGMELPTWQMKWIMTQACFKDKIKLSVIKGNGYKPKKKKRYLT